MNVLAEELNRTLADSCAGRLLSKLGQRMYFPKGILSQSAEATERAHAFNATVGMAYQNGEPIMLGGIRQQLPKLSAKEAVAYGPTSGVAAFRELWRKEMLRKNPSLQGATFSLPVAVPGLTAGISFLADLFIEEGDQVVVPDMFWPNYRLIVEERHCAKLEHYQFFNQQGGFNVAGLEEAIRKVTVSRKRCVVILNYPNNPTGYTPTKAEAESIRQTLLRIADSGVDLLVISDDAYFGLQFEADNLRESMFALLANSHERILACKVDGSTKEDYVWGFRGGFITFGGKKLDEHQYGALVKKLMGVIRSSISSPAGVTQYVMMKAMEHPDYASEKAKYADLMEQRYRTVKQWLAAHQAPSGLTPLPFNSGYFMCFTCNGYSAEALRLKLLDEYGIGTISLQEKWLRVAFSCIEVPQIDALFSAIYKAAAAMAGTGK